MSDSVSGVGLFLSSIQYIDRSQVELQKLSQQNSTGTKSVSLAGYGTDAASVLNLQSSVTETQGWINNSDQISTYLSSYSTALGQLTTDATSLQSALQNVSTSSSSSASIASLKATITGLEADVGATLNSQSGDRYIFAGSRYTTAPVVDLTTLATPTTPAAFTAASGTTIPGYDVDYAGGSPPGTVASGTPYYAQQQTLIGDNDTLTYGVTSNDPSIQGLVYALKQAEAGLSATSPTSDQYLANAQSAVSTALTGLSTLTAQNAQQQATVTSTQTAQQTAISNLQTQYGDITQVDSTTVATELSNIENQLEGSYKATSTLLNLTILTYLPS